jgi:putative hydrolase of the HAD superfamily
MEYIKELLDNTEPLEPISTNVAPEYRKDNSIRAVVFDIYGTLLISSSGDIDQAEISTKNLEIALSSSNIEVVDNSVTALEHILYDFEYTIKICHQEARKNDVPYPEIDILSIWEIVLLHARRKKIINFNGEANIMQMTCVFELLSNKTYPMPGMVDIIQKLSDKGMPIGIVSNAQFYTPIVMNYHLKRSIDLVEEIKFFDKELTVFSYKLGIGKPDTKLFDELTPVLRKKYNLEPEEVLFVGNDMLKDIYTSNKVGFKTALYAGDKRSLRMREDRDETKGLKPDYVITELNQLFEIIN